MENLLTMKFDMRFQISVTDNKSCFKIIPTTYYLFFCHTKTELHWRAKLCRFIIFFVRIGLSTLCKVARYVILLDMISCDFGCNHSILSISSKYQRITKNNGSNLLNSLLLHELITGSVCHGSGLWPVNYDCSILGHSPALGILIIHNYRHSNAWFEHNELYSLEVTLYQWFLNLL